MENSIGAVLCKMSALLFCGFAVILLSCIKRKCKKYLKMNSRFTAVDRRKRK